MVTTHEEMLAIVDNVAGDIIDEGVRPAAQEWALFQEKNSESARGQVNGGTQPAEATAENNHIVCRGW